MNFEPVWSSAFDKFIDRRFYSGDRSRDRFMHKPLVFALIALHHSMIGLKQFQPNMIDSVFLFRVSNARRTFQTWYVRKVGCGTVGIVLNKTIAFPF